MERVQFGVDDESNLAWGVERRLDAREPLPSSPGEGTSLIPPRPSDQTKGQAYDYVSGVGAESHWIFLLDVRTAAAAKAGAATPRRSVKFPHRVGGGRQRAKLLTDQERRLVESVIPLGGLEGERR